MAQSIEYIGGFDAAKFAADLREKSFDIIEDEFVKAVADLQRNSPVGASDSIGEPSLKNSWDIETIRDLGGEIVVNVVNPVQAALNRLEGRKAGKRPPSDALIPWVKFKLQIKEDKKAKSVAFLVARKIGREGTQRSKRNFKEFDPVTGQPVKNGAILRAITRIEKRIDGIKIIG